MQRERPLIQRFLVGLTLKRAIGGIVVVAFSFTLAAAVLMRIAEPETYRDLPEAIWWAAQTVSTVGYGDNVPKSTAGRAVGVAVMLFGVALVPAVTSLVVAVFVNQQLRARQAGSPGAGEDDSPARP